MPRPRLKTFSPFFFVLALASQLVGAETGWMNAPKPAPKAPNRMSIYVDRVPLFKLGELLKQSFEAIEEVDFGEYTHLMLNLYLKDANLKGVLNALRVTTGMEFQVKDGRLSIGERYRAPFVMPPSPKSLKRLAGSLKVVAQRQPLFRVLKQVAEDLGLQLAVPMGSSGMYVSLAAEGSVASVLEEIGQKANVQIGIENSMLRVREGKACPLRPVAKSGEPQEAWGRRCFPDRSGNEWRELADLVRAQPARSP